MGPYVSKFWVVQAFLLCEEERKTKNAKEFLLNFRKRMVDIILQYYHCLACLCHSFVIQNSKPVCVKTKQGFQSKKVSFIHYSFSLAEVLAIWESRSFCDLRGNVKPQLVYWSLIKISYACEKSIYTNYMCGHSDSWLSTEHLEILSSIHWAIYGFTCLCSKTWGFTCVSCC